MAFGISTKQDGMCMTTGPLDVCNTPAPPAPPIPMPYPNMAQCMQADPGTCTTKVKIGNQPALTKDSEIPMSSGDEAGSVGGVVSGTIKSTCTFKRFSSKVKLEGANAVYQLCNTAHNGKSPNAALGMQVSPSQTDVTVTL
jgi:hypothetical protein